MSPARATGTPSLSPAALALQTSWRALRRSEQALARLLKAKAGSSHADWQAKRRARTHHLIELGGLVVLAKLADHLEGERAPLLGAFLVLGDLLDGAGDGSAWAGSRPADLIRGWRERGRQALGPAGVVAPGRPPAWHDPRQAATRRVIELGGLVLKAGLVRRVDDDRATLLGGLLLASDLVDGEADGDLGRVSPADLRVRWRRRGLRAFDAQTGTTARPDAATPPREVHTAAG